VQCWDVSDTTLGKAARNVRGTIVAGQAGDQVSRRAAAWLRCIFLSSQPRLPRLKTGHNALAQKPSENISGRKQIISSAASAACSKRLTTRTAYAVLDVASCRLNAPRGISISHQQHRRRKDVNVNGGSNISSDDRAIAVRLRVFAAPCSHPARSRRLTRAARIAVTTRCGAAPAIFSSRIPSARRTSARAWRASGQAGSGIVTTAVTRRGSGISARDPFGHYVSPCSAHRAAYHHLRIILDKRTGTSYISHCHHLARTLFRTHTPLFFSAPHTHRTARCARLTFCRLRVLARAACRFPARPLLHAPLRTGYFTYRLRGALVRRRVSQIVFLGSSVAAEDGRCRRYQVRMLQKQRGQRCGGGRYRQQLSQAAVLAIA